MREEVFTLGIVSHEHISFIDVKRFSHIGHGVLLRINGYPFPTVCQPIDEGLALLLSLFTVP